MPQDNEHREQGPHAASVRRAQSDLAFKPHSFTAIRPPRWFMDVMWLICTLRCMASSDIRKSVQLGDDTKLWPPSFVIYSKCGDCGCVCSLSLHCIMFRGPHVGRTNAKQEPVWSFFNRTTRMIDLTRSSSLHRPTSDTDPILRRRSSHSAITACQLGAYIYSWSCNIT